MAKKKEKTAEDMLRNPMPEVLTRRDEQTPFDKTYDALMCTTGPRLELVTRTTRKLAKAVNIGHTWMFHYNSWYIRSRLDTMMRLHVSMGGKGRMEMVQSLQAGSGVPGEFYDQSNSQSAFMPTSSAEDDPDDE